MQTTVLVLVYDMAKETSQQVLKGTKESFLWIHHCKSIQNSFDRSPLPHDILFV